MERQGAGRVVLREEFAYCAVIALAPLRCEQMTAVLLIAVRYHGTAKAGNTGTARGRAAPERLDEDG